jgi:hypothetical protein
VHQRLLRGAVGELIVVTFVGYHGRVDVSHTAELAVFLHDALHAHDVEASREGDVLRLAGTDMRLSAAIVSERTFPTHATVQLDVRFEIGPGRTIVESCAGVGGDVAEAVENAQRSFAANALHVLLAAFAGVARDQVSEERWESGGRSFRAILGNVTGRGQPPAGGSPTGWLPLVAAAVRERPLPARTHWLRVYCARNAGADNVTEALLDGEEWPELAARLAAFPWPPTDGFYSVRVFLVLDGGFDTSRAVAAIHRLADRPDAEIVRALVAQGADPVLAEKLVDYVPIAFGRPVLERLGVRASEEGVLLIGSKERRFRLMTDPVFADAVALAREAYTRGSMPGDVFRAVVMRGAELRAVNEALTAGAKAQDLSLSAPCFSPSAGPS